MLSLHTQGTDPPWEIQPGSALDPQFSSEIDGPCPSSRCGAVTAGYTGLASTCVAVQAPTGTVKTTAVLRSVNVGRSRWRSPYNNGDKILVVVLTDTAPDPSLAKIGDFQDSRSYQWKRGLDLLAGLAHPF